MDARILAEIARLRAKFPTLPLRDVLRDARVNIAFLDAERSGRVEFHTRPDDCPDLSFLEQDCFSDVRAEQYSRANDEGTWGIFVTVDGTEVDAVYGFIGEDWQDSGYDVDLKRTALSLIEETPTHWLAL